MCNRGRPEVEDRYCLSQEDARCSGYWLTYLRRQKQPVSSRPLPSTIFLTDRADKY